MYIVQKMNPAGSAWIEDGKFSQKDKAYAHLTDMAEPTVHTRYRVVQFQVLDEFVVQPRVTRIERASTDEG